MWHYISIYLFIYLWGTLYVYSYSQRPNRKWKRWANFWLRSPIALLVTKFIAYSEQRKQTWANSLLTFSFVVGWLFTKLAPDSLGDNLLEVGNVGYQLVLANMLVLTARFQVFETFIQLFFFVEWLWNEFYKLMSLLSFTSQFVWRRSVLDLIYS